LDDGNRSVDGPRNLPPSVAVDADRDDHRHRNDAAGLAHFDVGGVNPQIQPARPRSVGPKAISVGRKLLYQVDGRVELALQLPFLKISESMDNHDSKIVGACSVD